MEAHLLRTFLAVAETGSFSAAAQRLGYTQSAVSQHIAALEADLGAALLTRRPVALTAAGERLRRHAELILVRLAAARADVTRALAPPGRLAVALTPLAWTAPVAAGFARIRAEAARLRATLHVVGHERVLAAVATGDADLGLVDGFASPSDPLQLSQGAGHGVHDSAAVVAAPVGHPLAGRSGVALADLADAYWIDAPGVTVLGRLPVDGLRAGLRYEGADVAVLTGLVAAGHGLAVLPGPVVDGHPGLVGVPIIEPRLTHRVEMLTSPGSPGPAAARLAALLAG